MMIAAVYGLQVSLYRNLLGSYRSPLGAYLYYQARVHAGRLDGRLSHFVRVSS